MPVACQFLGVHSPAVNDCHVFGNNRQRRCVSFLRGLGVAVAPDLSMGWDLNIPLRHPILKNLHPPVGLPNSSIAVAKRL